MQLPTVRFRGKRWFVDERLGQLRNVKSPHDFISFAEWDSARLRGVSLTIRK